MSAGLSYMECSARERVRALLDDGSFHEWLPPAARVMSPHLQPLGVPASFDDGVVIGRATLAGRTVFVGAQEGAFLGGGIGEVHGAKLVGLMARALRDRPDAVLLLADSGGVRLHEANAGLIGVSELMRAVFDVRAAGIPVIVLIGSANGCFGGMGLVARCADRVVISDMGRLAMSGPEVIEASHGVEEFDSRDRALVWRTTGGKHRYLIGDADVLVEDEVGAFRAAAITLLERPRPLALAALEQEHAALRARWDALPAGADARDWWARLGIAEPAAVPEMSVAELCELARAGSTP